MPLGLTQQVRSRRYTGACPALAPPNQFYPPPLGARLYSVDFAL
jgi:hypothetical protein